MTRIFRVTTQHFASFIMMLAILVITSSSSVTTNSNLRRREQQWRRKTAMLGGFSKIPVDDEDMLAAARFAFHEYLNIDENKHLKSLAHAFSIGEASRQVVAGMNYKILLILLGRGECVAAAEVKVYRDLDRRFRLLSSNGVGCTAANADGI
mmetsp:Transcript_59107/g.70508  ORF Transcript_59107/g.70508 Transcript_59107/m.70508 type:complete len:152 (-) Transcript_59107:184-639(-)|eukprot:CAMPEP_0172510118 /NCGR_PEP_ID=MMETSP1066-20121228/226343_1 /TAXON_ID=671091 /ORGANISM="Coscinodiscus wailesii, Strain CCMP2513" /LENGTH=151 /DNA_ID=CAMNT_0013288957 /DNA_START=104 /DNA_END=559 /DNA_ORIENTATION=+